MKLNGWQRIGIVASLAWPLIAGIQTLRSTLSADEIAAAHIIEDCESVLSDQPGRADVCDARGQEFLDVAIRGDRIEAVAVAVVPVPIGWGAAYLVIFIVRWVSRGFQQKKAEPEA